MQNYIQVKKIWQENDRQLGIIWTDDRKDIFDVVVLRRKCPCALCIDEWTHEPKLKPEDVPETLRPLMIQSVGRYALNIQFDDGHTTGIYTFTYLRELADGA
ncbi:DUF971 domain-containing protein [Pseudobacteriovorax antillogorgiicola]|uniref:DUF971 family protein n=1 Tax=Pseudobacteriovorax antillogorgiicola TaxID=1513793 RepID=A0A1Y6CIC9_9BACT|nr:DUF971 domain-containing protein [Pseudobacteriovorax antillogorgiicola]TCS46633.1 DUF971 family protein [Pseudobacteriovorax antillogorgiicola]SMF66160.1 DUF971 family protein [Pseudobacteriovorax antillogorgiicola]